MKRVLFLTNYASPYRVHFYDELAKSMDVTVLFTDREPDQMVLRVGGRRVNCFRLDYPVGDENYLIPKGQYSLILESNTPVVSVLGRLDRRKDFAYYEMDGFCM